MLAKWCFGAGTDNCSTVVCREELQDVATVPKKDQSKFCFWAIYGRDSADIAVVLNKNVLRRSLVISIGV